MGLSGWVLSHDIHVGIQCDGFKCSGRASIWDFASKLSRSEARFIWKGKWISEMTNEDKDEITWHYCSLSMSLLIFANTIFLQINTGNIKNVFSTMDSLFPRMMHDLSNSNIWAFRKSWHIVTQCMPAWWWKSCDSTNTLRKDRLYKLQATLHSSIYVNIVPIENVLSQEYRVWPKQTIIMGFSLHHVICLHLHTGRHNGWNLP